jgi:hypothetical protein
MSEEESTEPISPNNKPRTRFFRLKTIALWIPSVAAIAAAVFFYVQWQQAQKLVGQSTAGEQAATPSREEIDKVVRELSKIVLLPESETPTLSTITNKDELTENREFFQNSVNGDKVLVYQQAKKAFLYRPSTKKLVNLAPINVTDANQAQPTVAATTDPSSFPEVTEKQGQEEAESFTVVLRNGTSKQGLTYDFEAKLLGAFGQANVSDRDNAARDDYGKSVVVAVNLAKEALAQRVANELGLTLAELPSGESKEETDILIILGADQL